MNDPAPSVMSAIAVASDDIPTSPLRKLGHLPGPRGHWLWGNVRQLSPDPLPFLSAMRNTYGDCFTVGFLRNQRALMMMGPQANELLLLDRGEQFSNRLGWQVVAPFFGRNILVRDFADHHRHRRLMNHVFKAGALAGYLQQMQPILKTACERYLGTVDVYQQTKVMALDIAIQVFARVDGGLAEWYNDLNLVLSNVMALRLRLPGTKYNKALKARNRLRKRLMEELRRRRGRSGTDLFSQLANQRDEQGCRLSDQDVVDHMFGILFAAHDTTASTLAMMFWLLAEHPHWQQQAYQECRTLHNETGRMHLAYEHLDRLPTVEAIFKETLRMYAPIQFIPRRSISAFEFAGFEVPANTWILLAPQLTHFDEKFYALPQRFDPQRFLQAKPLPAFTFVPFGKGSHMCLGMHFAYMEIKAVLYRLLLSRRLVAAGGRQPELQYLPIVRPQQSMQVSFCPRSSQ